MVYSQVLGTLLSLRNKQVGYTDINVPRREETVFGVSPQVLHKPVYTVTGEG